MRNDGIAMGPRPVARAWAVASILIAMAASVHVAPAWAGDDDKALEAYEQGVALAKKGEFEKAIELFEKARSLGAPAEVLINLGKCSVGMGKIQEAVGYYQEYLADPEAKLADKVKEVLEELRVEPSPVKLASEPPGALVTMVLEDGTEVAIGPTPVEHEAAAGKVTFVIVMEGYEEAREAIEAGFGKPFEIAVELKAEAPEAAPEEGDGGAAEAHEGEGDEEGSGAATGARFPSIGIFVEAGGGAALFPNGNVDGVDFQVGADISAGLGYRFAPGMASGFSIGVQVDLRTYELAGDTDWVPREWTSLMTHILAVPGYQFGLHRRVALEVSLPLGIAIIVPTRPLRENDYVNLVGGYIVGGNASLFDVGLAVGVRIAVVSGFTVTIEPAHVHLLVPLKEWHSGAKVLVNLDMGARLGFEF